MVVGSSSVVGVNVVSSVISSTVVVSSFSSVVVGMSVVVVSANKSKHFNYHTKEGLFRIYRKHDEMILEFHIAMLLGLLDLHFVLSRLQL